MGGLTRHVDLQISENVVAGPRACHRDQTKTVNHGGLTLPKHGYIFRFLAPEPKSTQKGKMT